MRRAVGLRRTGINAKAHHKTLAGVSAKRKSQRVRGRLRRASKKRRSQEAEYTAFVLGIKARDGWRCVYCRTRSGALDPHHEPKRSQDSSVLMDPNHCVTLCRKCHDWTDASYASREGRLVVDPIGRGQFAFSIVRGASKFAVRALSVGSDH